MQDDEIPSDQDEIHTLTDRSLCHSDVSQKTETTVRENESPSVSNVPELNLILQTPTLTRVCVRAYSERKGESKWYGGRF